MRRALLITPVLTLVLAAAAPDAGAASSCRGADAAPDGAHMTTVRSATLCLLNVERRRHHLAPLRSSSPLTGLAHKFARRMVAEHFFDHTAPDGTTFGQRVRRSSYIRHARDYSAGENIGVGSDPLATPREMVDAWMHSSHHRRNILDPKFRDIGVGVVRGMPDAGGAGATYVTDFGHRTL
jgi:uncharacterized protein YkwD